MTDISTYKDEVYEIYELVHDTQTAVVGTTITVTGYLPHADVITSTGHSTDRTRVYVNGVLVAITSVEVSGANTDIIVPVAIESGDDVDIFLATSTGTLSNNGAVGKFPLVELQTMQDYGATSNTFKQPGCGTERKESIAFAADGDITLGMNRRGNTNMKNFTLARKGKVYLMILVKDTTDPANITYDILHEVRVVSYGRAGRALDAEGGKITDTITFSFVPDAAVST